MKAEFLSQKGPRWYTIPADRPFLDDLAEGLLALTEGEGPEALSDAVILTPTRRAARSLTEAFLRRAGSAGALLPPRIRPLGDLEAGEAPFEPGEVMLDLPPAITPVRRRFELLKLVGDLSASRERTPGPAEALGLADALGAFFDSLQIEEVTGENLDSLVGAEMAEHWQVSLDLLRTALDLWPRRLEALGLEDVSRRRVLLLRALAERWREVPPPGLLIAAGSTGSVKATAGLLQVIAAAPRGAVVLPGLDTDDLSPEAMGLEVDEQHPQSALYELLSSSGVARKEVLVWGPFGGDDPQGADRRKLISLALRPAARTSDWLATVADENGPGVRTITRGLEGLTVISSRDEEACALTAALLLRETLETPGRTAALVTPDQDLARRVCARLARWGVTADASAGEPLAGRPCAVLASLAARALADPALPSVLLGLLKHPLVRLQRDPEVLAMARDDLERRALRRTRSETLDELRRRGETARDPAGPEALQLLEAYAAALAEPGGPGPEARHAGAWALRLTQVLEALCTPADGGTGTLWAGPDGEAMARLLAQLVEDGAVTPELTIAGFIELFEALVAGESVRSARASHPRLRILGAMEARMARADRVILAGLEEGVWPQAAGVDPFLSRTMRKALGLPAPERRIALSAHDFAQSACAPEVFLLNTRRRRGAPVLESRWLWRLRTLARGADATLAGRPDLTDLAEALDGPGPFAPALRPAPCPPVEARPRKLAVTRVEALVRDPYQVWARDILRLYPMDRPDTSVDVRIRGTAIHSALETFVETYPADLPADAADVLDHLYIEALRAAGMDAIGLAREQALAREIAAWMVDQERQRRRDGRRIEVEQAGQLTFSTRAGNFVLTAKADRLEIGPEQIGRILDYKTGAPPSTDTVKTGFSPQLTLTGAILEAGGFPGLKGLKVEELSYVRITGRRPAGEIRSAIDTSMTATQASAAALEGLKARIEAFDNPNRPYTSRVAPSSVKLYASDYDHLARVREWSSIGEGEDT